MSVITRNLAGTFCWPELCSGDAPVSKKFYYSLFGWESSDIEMPEGVYTLFKLGGQNIGAMYQMAEERKAAGVLPHWNSYVAVDDADATVKKAAKLGGKVLMEPMDADAGRIANLQDPTGAKFSIWQTLKQPEPMRLMELGALCWTELYTRDARKATAFYSGLFGWQPKAFEGAGAMPYATFSLAGDERPVGGMLEMPKEMPGEPHWLPYYQVDDADRTAERTRELGGKIINPPMDIPTVGRMALLADPQGAEFAVIKFVFAGK